MSDEIDIAAEEQHVDSGVILALLHEHPGQLSLKELASELESKRIEELDIIDSVNRLARLRIIHRNGDLVLASRPTVRVAQLLGV